MVRRLIAKQISLHNYYVKIMHNLHNVCLTSNFIRSWYILVFPQQLVPKKYWMFCEITVNRFSLCYMYDDGCGFQHTFI